MNITGSQKACFMAVASLSSYTRASKQLHISQPAVTKQIQALERELRVTLLERDKKTVQLTENGERFYRLIQKQDREMNEFLDEARQREKSFAGTVRIGLPSGWDIHRLHDEILAEFREKYPNMRLQIVVHYFLDLYRLLVEDEVDIIMTLPPMLPRNPQIVYRNIGKVEHAACISNLHPLAQNNPLNITELADDTFYLTQDDEAGWQYWRNNIQAAYGFEPSLEISVNYLTQLTYIRGGSGVALIDMFCRTDTEKDFRLIPIGFDESVCLAWRKDSTSSERSVVASWIEEYFKTNKGL